MTTGGLVRAQCGACGTAIDAGEGPRLRCSRCGAAYDLRAVESIADGPMRSMSAHELAPSPPPPPHRRLLDRSRGRTIRHVHIQPLSGAAHGSGGWLLAGVGFIMVPLMLSAAAGTMPWSWVWVFGLVVGVPATIITLKRASGGEELRIESGMIVHATAGRRRTLRVTDVLDVMRTHNAVVIRGRDGTELSVGSASSLDYSALDWLHRHINDGLAVARERPSLEAPR